MTALVPLFRPLAFWRQWLKPRPAAGRAVVSGKPASAKTATADTSAAAGSSAQPGLWTHTTVAASHHPLVLMESQTALQWLARGAVLHVHRGALTVEEAPRGWAGRAWCQTWALPRGQVWVAPRAAWVRLTAGPGRCEFSARRPAGRHCPPPPPC
ncbi:hypothetical protein [Roseateles sp. YR242]|uniref:hypothetical protein n=1 Tax=Roseateles sp. YR242 TaxID=1855305 RepID=UPI0011603A93|nr:hypothetical protein [Roseateles sp. YR242]